MVRGSDVHKFYDKVFDYLECDNGVMTIGNIDFGEDNVEYKRNVVNYQIRRWFNCVAAKGDEAKEYFYPFVKEKKFVLDNVIDDVTVVGIPDVIERKFDDGYLVVEIKTGKPTKKKCLGYRNELIWYKLIGEAAYDITLNEGRLYFPINNHIEDFNLYDVDVESLKCDILKVADGIRNKKYDATPEKSRCRWCNYNKYCEYK